MPTGKTIEEVIATMPEADRRKHLGLDPQPAPSAEVLDGLDAEIERLTGQKPCQTCGR